ncbi:OmpH family outer membrane protein [Luteolibacter pohnpeiensis]|uniref:OmpH family outer membrane protein n=1 Tax=Luteolibacter pohnpeiensis TaxID=454153 RepID=A0A934VWB3_9BACT|nr:OmpH family outer membrane protein [Luteolibacter pohnpeiensis]MBK1882638.1 OmpH family outer membrane protein [Luteolibacter pohnpeiensis]
MKRLAVLILTFVYTIVGVMAAPKFALVRVQDIYRGLPESKALQDEVTQKREDLMKDQRAIELGKNVQELKNLQSQIQNKGGPLDFDATRELARKFENLRRQTETLQHDFESFRAERSKQINRDMVEVMRKNLQRIAEVSAKVAKEQGYDAVFDSSGNTNTGIPFILYSKSAPDLTDFVIAALQDANSEPPVEKANH